MRLRRSVGIALGSFCTGVALVALVAHSTRSGGTEGPSTPVPSRPTGAGRAANGPGGPNPAGASERGGPAILLADATPELRVVVVELTSTNYRWQADYPGSAAHHSGADVHLPADSGVQLRLRSRDYVHMLSVPPLGLRLVVVPGQLSTLAFRTTGPGSFTIEGDRLCGGLYPSLDVKVIVEPQPTFRAWLDCRQRENDR